MNLSEFLMTIQNRTVKAFYGKESAITRPLSPYEMTRLVACVTLTVLQEQWTHDEIEMHEIAEMCHEAEKTLVNAYYGAFGSPPPLTSGPPLTEKLETNDGEERTSQTKADRLAGISAGDQPDHPSGGDSGDDGVEVQRPSSEDLATDDDG